MGIILIVAVLGVAWIVLVQAHDGGKSIFATHDHGSRDAGKTPLELLQTRYAAGEIDKAEYDRRRQDILGLD